MLRGFRRVLRISGSVTTAYRTHVYAVRREQNLPACTALDNSLVISRLSMAVSEADYLARDLIRPLEILCDFCGHRTNVSWRFRQRCLEINRLTHLAAESQLIRH